MLGEAETFPSQVNIKFETLGQSCETLIFGYLGGILCKMTIWPENLAIPAGLIRADFFHLFGLWAQGELDAMSRARQLAAWLCQNKFCGVCGQPMQTRPDEPIRECTSCKHKIYPRISPVSIGLVMKGNEMLLARSPHFPPGIYSALAGFVEVGESVEQCLRREVREEAGIEIKNIRWFGSQSWPFPDSLMIGFIADYADGEILPQINEIEDLRWFKKNELPSLPHPSTLAYQMIQSVLRAG